MPIYKNVPGKKPESLPFYRPVDKVAFWFWNQRRLMVPIVILTAVTGSAWAGLSSYRSWAEGKAAVILETDTPEKVVDRYPRSSAARIARIQLGDKALAEEKWDEAIRLFQKVAEDRRSDAFLRITALQNEGLALAKKGEWVQSVAVLEKASKDPDNAMADYSSLLLAHVYALKGDEAESKEIYRILSEGAKLPEVKLYAKSQIEPPAPAPKLVKTKKK